VDWKRLELSTPSMPWRYATIAPPAQSKFKVKNEKFKINFALCTLNFKLIQPEGLFYTFLQEASRG
jgi:hypothetical protein